MPSEVCEKVSPITISPYSAIMYIYPVNILRLKHGYHLTYYKGSHTDSSSSTQPGFSQPLSRVDRGSAIAPGILAVLILTAAGWFCSVQIKKKKERDAGQHLWRQESISTQPGGNFGAGPPRLSSEKLFARKSSTRSRADSGMSTLAVGGTDGWRVRRAGDQRLECQSQRTIP